MRDRKRTLMGIAGVAVAALTLGLVLGKFVITSPADAAANTAPPEAGAITVPVELRTLESRVVTRGDASFAGAVELSVEVSGLEAPIVTGQVPEMGDEVAEGDAALEIAGRPVIVLEGELPMYRTLRPGMSGPDVQQLEETLDRLGFDPGTVDESYTAATGRAVREIYDSIGYEAPAADPEAQAERDAAQDFVLAAEDEVRLAEDALKAASQGPSKSERVMAEQAVDSAKRTVQAAKESADEAAIADAEDQLELAEINLAELLAGPDTSGEKAAAAAAKSRLSDARVALETAQAAAGTPLPASEVIYVASLPRRVDQVNVRRGGEIDGAVMSVSGADMVIVAQVSDADRTLLDVDMPVLFDLPTGEQVEATISDIEVADGEEATGYEVTIEPGELTVEQTDVLRQANVRVVIPVSSTEGDVLAVPLAALTYGPGGESRVEVSRGGEMVLVEVEVGLTADGYVEVDPVDGVLEPGDLVVVGDRDGDVEDASDDDGAGERDGGGGVDDEPDEDDGPTEESSDDAEPDDAEPDDAEPDDAESDGDEGDGSDEGDGDEADE